MSTEIRLPTSFVVTLSCTDRVGIVHAVTAFLLERDANITEAAQFNDASTGLFFLRMRFDASETSLDRLREEFTAVAEGFAMKWGMFGVDERIPTLIMVSRSGHCLNDLLFRYRAKLLPIDIRGVVSNHRDHYQLVASHDIPFHHLPVDPAAKAAAESRLLEIVAAERIELVVLARYMQVLSETVCRQLEGKVINIHHSFLPSFKGAAPYQQAFQRGVKIIGATAHYVTADLDEGSIIEQDIVRADHGMNAAALADLGRDVESGVLARAVSWHAQRRVLVDGRKTIVFR